MPRRRIATEFQIAKNFKKHEKQKVWICSFKRPRERQKRKQDKEMKFQHLHKIFTSLQFQGIINNHCHLGFVPRHQIPLIIVAAGVHRGHFALPISYSYISNLLIPRKMKGQMIQALFSAETGNKNGGSNDQ